MLEICWKCPCTKNAVHMNYLRIRKLGHRPNFPGEGSGNIWCTKISKKKIRFQKSSGDPNPPYPHLIRLCHAVDIMPYVSRIKHPWVFNVADLPSGTSFVPWLLDWWSRSVLHGWGHSIWHLSTCGIGVCREWASVIQDLHCSTGRSLYSLISIHGLFCCHLCFDNQEIRNFFCLSIWIMTQMNLFK